MRIEESFLQKMARLAQLEIVAQNESVLRNDLDRIVTWIEQLKTLDTTGIEPITTMAPTQLNLQEDFPKPSLAHENALENAPSHDTNYFRVPQVKE